MKHSVTSKTLALLLSAVLCIAPLAGCQGRQEPEESSSSQQSSSQEESSSSQSSSQEESSSQESSEESSSLPLSSSSSSVPSTASSAPSASSSTPVTVTQTSAQPFNIPAQSITKIVVYNGGHDVYDDIITVTGQEDITEIVNLFNNLGSDIQKSDPAKLNPPTGGMIPKIEFHYADGSVAQYYYNSSIVSSEFFYSTSPDGSWSNIVGYYSENPLSSLVNEIPEKMLKKYPTNSSYFNYSGAAKGWILDDQNMLYFPLTQNETNQILKAMCNFGTVQVSDVDPGAEGWSSNIRIQRQNSTEDLYEYECHETGIAVDGGKFFLVDSAKLNALYSLRDSMMNRTTGIPQWIVVMNTSRATNMTLTAGGKVYSTDAKDIIADVTAQLKQLSCHTGTLKTPESGDYSDLSAEVRRIELDFETGTHYTFTIHENGELAIAATGLDFMCVYQTVSGQTLSALGSRVDSLAAQGQPV